MLGRRLPALLLALAAGSAAPAPAAGHPGQIPLAQKLARALAVPHVAPSHSAALAFDLGTGTTVYAQNDSEPLAPASNEKLAVTYAALVALGPGFRIETEVFGEGRLEGSTWLGPLVLEGHGDPTLSTSDLVLLARQIRAAGITRITGGIRGDESFFDSRRMAPGWNASFYINESPPLSALTVDRGWFRGHVTPAPALAAAITFRAALRGAGVSVAGAAATGAAGADASLLAAVESPPLENVIRFMDHESDNFTAELLLKQLGALGGAQGTTAGGADLVRGLLLDARVPLTGVRIVDGSGLSGLDRLTARALVGILRSAWADPDLRPSFFAALPVAGRSGTLSDRMRRPPAVGQVVAKTGTTRIASALSGFVKRRFVFALLENGYPISTWWARRAQDRFATVLAAQ